MIIRIPGIGLYIRVVDMSQKGLYKRVQYDPVTHRTFFKPKKGGAQSSNATAAVSFYIMKRDDGKLSYIALTKKQTFLLLRVSMNITIQCFKIERLIIYGAWTKLAD